MQITAATGRTSGTQRWMRTLILTAGIALLVNAVPRSAAAEDNSYHRALAQIAECEAQGGTATVDVSRSPNGSVLVIVTCEGALNSIFTCYNWANGPTTCYETYQKPGGSPFAPIDETLPLLESGSVDQFMALLPDLEAGNDQGSDVQ